MGYLKIEIVDIPDGWLKLLWRKIKRFWKRYIW